MSQDPLYVPPKARAWLLANPGADAATAARALDLAVGSVRTYRHRLIKAGLLDRRGMRAKLRAVRDGIREGHSRIELARRLGVHPGTVTWRVAQLDTVVYDLRRDQVYSGRELAAMFGYAPDSGGSYEWLARLQAAGLAPTAPHHRKQWRVTAEQLMAFLENPASWPLIKLKRIKDADWKAYAEQARAGAFAQRPSRVTGRTKKQAAREAA